MHKVFTYGTLRKGCSRNYVLKDSSFLGEATTAAKYSLYSLGSFPALTVDGKTSVLGELYEVSDEVLDLLDRIEGHPNFYTRSMVEISNGEEVYAYFLDGEFDNCSFIESGDWVSYIKDPCLTYTW
jgi:gamma-glutamylcyclotransferase (GGCT)/AIG2-like uncharacterized protein YtfP